MRSAIYSWFPTGGGKTEAYPGIGRLHDGSAAAARRAPSKAARVKMASADASVRYTLRLLTLQQFQRAAALYLRLQRSFTPGVTVEKGDKRWGETPFPPRVVGGPKNHAKYNLRTGGWSPWVTTGAQRTSGMPASSGSPHQLTNCPWCGSKLDSMPERNLRVEKYSWGPWAHVLHFAAAISTADAAFTAKQSPDEEGLPVLVVDEEIYRRLPAHADCHRGQIRADAVEREGPNAFRPGRWLVRPSRIPFPRDGRFRFTPKARAVSGFSESVPRKPTAVPPDLIIQDELHLISGPLGTLVGFGTETAVDQHLCSWTVGGRRSCAPK